MSFLQIVLLVLAVLLFLRAFNLIAGLRWYNIPPLPGSTILVDGRRFYYTLKGSGTPTVVIEAGLGSVSPEWWKIQDSLSSITQVLTYDRAGYGWSEYNPNARTSNAIAGELDALLTMLGIDGPLILVGHSQGGLYVNHFARLHAERVAGVVFVDPLSPDDDRLRVELPPHIYKASVADKTGRIRALSRLCAFGLLRVLKPLVKRAAAFSHHKDLPAETAKTLWRHLLLPKTHKTMLGEYREAHKAVNSEILKRSGAFPRVPVKVLYHSPEKMIDEIVRRSSLGREDAERVEKIWQELVREYLSLSSESEWIVEGSSSHFIHLDAPGVVLEAVEKLLDRAGKEKQG
jgi:pimeloyl-ACP methyl ester carboxylesterase